MKTSPHIVRMRPHLVEKVWGGRRLEERFGKKLSPDLSYGEAWEIADLEQGQSCVDSGPLAGLPLRALAEGWERALVGRKAPRSDRFPLLVKLLDASKDLSVQVHPGPEDAARMEGAHSKEETWLILDVDDGAEIIHGLVGDEVTRADFQSAVSDGKLEELLHRVAVSSGDIVDVVPGTIHAICAGVALLEIQEPSDTTYRVYDYDRPGLDGKPRQLHIDEALKVANLSRSPTVVTRPMPTDSEHVDLVTAASSYRIERLQLDKPARVSWKVDPDSPQILHVLDGELSVEDGIGGQVELQAYQSAIVPALIGSVHAEIRQPTTVVVAGLAVEELIRGLRLHK